MLDVRAFTLEKYLTIFLFTHFKLFHVLLKMSVLPCIAIFVPNTVFWAEHADAPSLDADYLDSVERPGPAL